MRAASVCSYIKVTTTNTGCKSVITYNRFLCYNRGLRGAEKVLGCCYVNLLHLIELQTISADSLFVHRVDAKASVFYREEFSPLVPEHSIVPD
jgi:hypothetical protein